MPLSHSLKIEGLSIKRGSKVLYRDFHLTLKEGEVTVLTSPSGTGKTTLLSFIAGILESGKDCTVSGTITGKDEGRVSCLFQEGRLLGSVNVLRNVSLPLENLMSKEESYYRAFMYLKMCGLEDKLYSYPEALSGGEKQRVAVARAFAYPSSLLLMDEAFTSLDVPNTIILLKLFKEMQKEEKKTVLFVTHSMQEACAAGDRIIVMNGSPLEIKCDIKNTKNDDIEAAFIEPPDEIRRIQKFIAKTLCLL